MSKPSIKIVVDTSELEKSIEQAEQLVETLKKANSLADELADKKLDLNCSITNEAQQSNAEFDLNTKADESKPMLKEAHPNQTINTQELDEATVEMIKSNSCKIKEFSF